LSFDNYHSVVTTARNPIRTSDAEAAEQASLALVELTLKAMSASQQLSVLQLRALLAVEQHGPLRLGAVAQLLDLSAPSASRLIARLVDDGLILRTTAPHERRQLQLAVSAKGRRLLSRLRGLRQREIGKVLEAMRPETRDALIQGLTAFAAAANNVLSSR
jgi:DNA-binding MarR family transcriptional regulator